MHNKMPISVEAASRLAAGADLVLHRKDDGTALLFDPGSSRLRQLNPYALAVWELIDGQREVGEILMALADRYTGFDRAAEEQVLALLAAMVDAGLLGDCDTGGRHRRACALPRA